MRRIEQLALLDAEFHAAQLQTKRSPGGAARSRPFRTALYRFGLRHFLPALFARATGVIVPEIKHRLTEVFDDVAAVEVDVFHYCPQLSQ